ncbi:DUF6232 family protein [Pantoea cypripedii]|uniref:DUF6232 family protein n=1 Tax=Pantoea cypripedii TaxID=55209 RepID=UPI002FCC35B7
MEEVEFFNDGKVSVTSARFRVGASTYAMQGVTSVKRGQKDANKFPAILMVIIGIITLLGAEHLSAKAIGGVLIVLGVVIFKKLKPEFSVYLNSSSGESQALQSKDKEYIDKVINALNESIVHRG